jgi:hypothetical protein
MFDTDGSAIKRQPPCKWVAAEFGYPLDEELLYDPAMYPIIQDLAISIEASYATPIMRIETGAAATRAIEKLGCTACVAVVCPVRSILNERIATNQESIAVEQMAKEITEAPSWLTAARLNNPDITIARLQEIATNGDAAREALANGEIAAFLGVARSRAIGVVRKEDLPEIVNIAAIDSGHPLTAYNIQTPAGRFTVIDASEANTSSANDTPEQRREYYGILCTKLLQRMSNAGANAQPAVLDPDSTQQKRIYGNGAHRMDELRKSGKDRLYILVTTATGDQDVVARIVILGSHGAGVEAQKRFINDMCPRSPDAARAA